jgi:beta-lactam-binding protein with PASTA domain
MRSGRGGSEKIMKKIVTLTLFLVFLVVLGSGVFTVYAVFWGGKEVSVPSLEGMSIIEAVDVAQRMGLVVRVDQVDSLKKSGLVLSQWPAAGTLVKNGKVLILKVSKGGQRFPLPDVRGMEYEQSLRALQEEGFTAGDVIRVSHPQVPPGVIVAQSPAAPAAVPRETRVDLLVSLGGTKAGTAVVPDLAGRNEAEAKRLLEGSGLKLGTVRYLYTQTTPPGVVMRMEPAAGKTVSQGARVEIIVATAQKPKETPPQETTAPGAVTIPGQQKPGQQTVVVEQPSQPLPQVHEPARPTPIPQAPPQTSPEAVKKLAKIRYQVPPLTKPLELRIEIVDVKGTRQILKKEVKGGEYITLNEPYQSEAAVTIYLGGDFVWQDRYR